MNAFQQSSTPFPGAVQSGLADVAERPMPTQSARQGNREGQATTSCAAEAYGSGMQPCQAHMYRKLVDSARVCMHRTYEQVSITVLHDCFDEDQNIG